MSEWLKIALGAFAGILVGLIVQFWKSLRDERRVLCDEFCKVALESADAASAYWKGGSAAGELEASKLLAMQRRLDGYRVLLRPAFTQNGADEIDRALVELFDSLTGGDFRSKGKPADDRRSGSAQAHAAELVITIRRAFIEAVSPSNLIRRIFILLPISLSKRLQEIAKDGLARLDKRFRRQQ